MTTAAPDVFDVPDLLPPQLKALLEHWQDLRRGENNMPFSDDIELSRLPGGATQAMLLEVFEGPLRFRLDYVGPDIAARLGPDVTGKFLDEIAPYGPFENLAAQATDAVERRVPRYYRHGVDYCRMLLPAWNDGRIGMLLGAVASIP